MCLDYLCINKSMNDSITQMRDIMMIAEYYSQIESPQKEVEILVETEIK